VTLSVTKARYGLIPDLVGSSLADARAQLRRVGVRVRVRYGKGARGTILRQNLAPGVAAWPGITIRLLVGR
jgi:beta-lactam-binding protein with PASTA domain